MVGLFKNIDGYLFYRIFNHHVTKGRSCDFAKNSAIQYIAICHLLIPYTVFFY